MIPVWPTIAAAAALFALAMLVAFRGSGVVARHRHIVIVITVATTLVSIGQIVDLREASVRLALDPSEEPMLNPAAPERAVYDEAIANFGTDDLFVVAMTTDDVFTQADLEALRRINTHIRRIPGVRSANSLVETTTYRYDTEFDTVEITKFIDDIPSDTTMLAELKSRALADRVFPKTIVSKDARTAAVNVSFRTMTDGEFVDARIDEQIKAATIEETTSTRTFHMTGRQHIKVRARHLMVEDLLRLVPLAVLAGALVAWIVTGSFRAALIPVGASLIATAWTFAWLIHAERPLTLIGIVLGPMLICVGSVYGVHVMGYFDESVSETSDPLLAASACIDSAAQPVAIAGATTIAGFSALGLSRTPAVQELGVLCVFGIAGVTLLSLTLVPALLSLLPLPPSPESRSRHSITAMIQRGLDRGLRLAVRASLGHTRGTLVTWSIMTVAAAAMIPQIVVDTDYLSFFNENSDVRRDFAAINEKLVGAVPIYVTVDGTGEGAFRDPAALEALRELQARIDTAEGVDATLSVLDIIEPLNRAIERDDPAAETIPQTRGQISDLFFLVPKTEMRRFMNSNHSRANIVVRTSTGGSADVLALERRIRDAALRDPGLPEFMSFQVTGNTIVVNRAGDTIARDQTMTVAIAAIAIFALVGRAVGSFALGALAMIPNVVPVLLFFGLLGIGAAPLSLPTSMVGCIALGIAVDDTAHFLVGYRRRRKAGLDGRTAVAQTVGRVGRPIATTSLMLVAGFSVLQLSNFATLREFGGLAAITMGLCLLADLVLLPALLRVGTEGSKS